MFPFSLLFLFFNKNNEEEKEEKENLVEELIHNSQRCDLEINQ